MELDQELGKIKSQIKLVLVGAFALQLMDVSGEYTADIDSVEPLDDLITQKIISDIDLQVVRG